MASETFGRVCKEPVHCNNCGVHHESECRCSAGWEPIWSGPPVADAPTRRGVQGDGADEA